MLTCTNLSENKESTSPSANENSKYTFVVEWYDSVAQIVKKFLMTYFSNDQTVELFDLKNHRIFLRRCKQEGINLENLYKSSMVMIMSRQMKVVNYADSHTKKKFEVDLTSTFCLVKPDAAPRMGEIIAYIQKNGFKITKLKMGKMTLEGVSRLYFDRSHEKDLVSFVASGPSIAMTLFGENAIHRLKECIGPMDPSIAKKEAPHTLRAMFGTDSTKNGIHGSQDEEHLDHEADVWFPKEVLSGNRINDIIPTCIIENTTCCIIKPHAVLEGIIGEIITFIYENGFKITAMEMFNIDVATAEEFYEVYKGVVPEYSAMVVQLTSGPSVVIEVLDSKNPECSQQTFRNLAGPTDPEIARKLRPCTIRAKFGKNKVMNAIHCTDLPEDAKLEVEYFFKILQS